MKLNALLKDFGIPKIYHQFHTKSIIRIKLEQMRLFLLKTNALLLLFYYHTL